MKRLWLIAMLWACGDSDPHEITTCGPSWGANSEYWCELACTPQPANQAGSGDDMPCSATHPDDNGAIATCRRTFDFEGQRGCCQSALDPGRDPVFGVRFLACN